MNQIILQSAAITIVILFIVYGFIGICIWLIQNGYGV